MILEKGGQCVEVVTQRFAIAETTADQTPLTTVISNTGMMLKLYATCGTIIVASVTLLHYFIWVRK